MKERVPPNLVLKGAVGPTVYERGLTVSVLGGLGPNG